PKLGLRFAAQFLGHIGGRMNLQREPVLGVEQLDEQGKARKVRHVAEDFRRMVDPEIVQRLSAPGPCRTTLWASGRSTISQASPIFRLAGSLLPKSLSSRRPPQIRSMKIGSKTEGWVRSSWVMWFCR